MADDLTTSPNALRSTLRCHTDARILLARAGDAVATSDQLAFQLDHALARDAVHARMNAGELAAQVAALGLTSLQLASAAAGRASYLRRPDLGRVLDPRSLARLEVAAAASTAAPDVLFLIADGLSALAAERHAAALLRETLARIDRSRWTVGPVPLLEQARVALADQVGARLNAAMTVLLIGERPGLSAPDSLGVYLTWNPQPERTDAERNCISNIRGGGLSYVDAAIRVVAYMEQARALAYTGVHLKETSVPALPAAAEVPGSELEGQPGLHDAGRLREVKRLAVG